MADEDAIYDASLWARALKGKINDPYVRHLDAHFLRFANGLHTSLSSLERLNPEWREHHRLPFPFPNRQSLPHTSAPSWETYNDNFLHSPLACPACGQEMNRFEYMNTLQHLLYTCTNAEVSTARLQMLTNLGERLVCMGSPAWWEEIPTPVLPALAELRPLSHPTTAHVWHTLTRAHEPQDHSQHTHSLIIKREGETTANIAAAYLHATVDAHFVPNTLSPALVSSLPFAISPAQIPPILHPALIRAAVDIFGTHTELFAVPPYLSHHVPFHVVDPSTGAPSTLFSNPPPHTLTWNAIGTLPATSPALSLAIAAAAARARTDCTVLFIQGKLHRETLQALKHQPSVEQLTLPAGTLPQPHQWVARTHLHPRQGLKSQFPYFVTAPTLPPP